MLLVVVNNGVFVELKCILHELDESKLLREKEDYVILDLGHYHTCKPTGLLSTVWNQVTSNGKEKQLSGHSR